VMTDHQGEVVWQADYLPFGETGVVGTVENNFRFPGQYFDQETGLYYNYFRHYNPVTGRYLTPDPIGLARGINLYAYCLNNSIILIDPWGLCGEKGFWDTVRTIVSGVGEAGQGLWNALGNEDLQRGTAQGFIMAGKVTAVTYIAVAVKAYALYDVATGGPVTTAAVGTVLTNPQGSLDFVTSMFPGTIPTPNWPGVYGTTAGKILETDKW